MEEELDFSGLEHLMRKGRDKKQEKSEQKKTAASYSSGKVKPKPADMGASGKSDMDVKNSYQKNDCYKNQQNKNQLNKNQQNKNYQNNRQSDYQGSKKNNRKPNWNYNGYVGAPYNFIPISDKTYDYTANSKEKKPHDAVKKELLSGCILYQIEAKTPIMVDSGKKEDEKKDNGRKESVKQGKGEFYKDAYGRFAIPGSSIRGLVRSNAQILSFADVSGDIEDYNLMYRSVAGGLNQENYTNILGILPENSRILKNVKAGYIAKKEKKYIIYQTKVEKINDTYGEMNYYVASEREILEEYQSNMEKSRFQYLFSSELITQYTKDCKFQKEVNPKTNQNKYVVEQKWMFNGRLNGPYKPYIKEVSYEIYGEHKIGAIGKPGKYSRKGYLLSSGAMEQKKAIYIIPEIDMEKDYICITERDADSYKRDLEGKKTKIKEKEEFYRLPEEGEIKPVFYIEYGGRLYFGFTPRLRLFYEKSVKEGLKQKATELDYCKALFGYAETEDSYKSRLSFQDACTENGEELEMRELLLGTPKPTSYLDYIENTDGSEKVVTYNDEFCLRGIKQYWLKEQEETVAMSQIKNKNMRSKLKPLCAGTVFHGKVHFHNLTEDELGLLLWSLELNKESEQNIGKAKAYGYGRIKVTVACVEIFELEEAYDLDKFSLQPLHTIKQEEKEVYINCFKSEIRKWLGREPEEHESIKNFLLMKDSNRIPGKKKTRYMSLDKKEYQARVNAKYPLPKIDKVIKQQEVKL